MTRTTATARAAASRPAARSTVVDLLDRPDRTSAARPADPAPALTGDRPVELKPVLSVAEAADLLGVSAWLVLQQIRRGELPHKRCGRRIVLSRDRLLAWLNDD